MGAEHQLHGVVMAFSQAWDDAYRLGDAAIPVWPFSDLVRLVHRSRSSLPDRVRVLEVGFGSGANSRLAVELGMEYWGIEGSTHAVNAARRRFPHVGEQFCGGDFTRAIPAGPFDMIWDRSAITHNSTEAIADSLRLLGEQLREGSIFIGVDWFSTAHSDSHRGESVDDWTRTNIDSGQFRGVGNVHFSSAEHITEMLGHAGFVVTSMEHKTRQEFGAEHRHASWDFVARWTGVRTD
jgi:SAM-dependent methyltransferase